LPAPRASAHTEEIVAIASRVTLDSTTVVAGDVRVISTTIEQGPGASIQGTIRRGLDLAGAALATTVTSLVVDDGEDPPAGEGRADLEVVQAAGPPQGDGARDVGDVVAEAEVAPDAGAGRQRPGCGPVRLAGRGPADRPVWPLLVVGEAEGSRPMPQG
jgi:hypothetical protein